LIIQTSFRWRVCIVVWQITDAIKPQGWVNGKQAGYAAGMALAGMALNFRRLGPEGTHFGAIQSLRA
jgi:hypothetical protein